MRILILLLVFSIPVAAQDKSLKVNYDRIADRTSISTKQYEIDEATRLMLYFYHQGKHLTQPVLQAQLMFDATSTDWQYLREADQVLYILADDQRFQLTNPKRESKVPEVYSRYSRVPVREKLMFTVDKTTLETIANSQKVEMRIGRKTFTLGKGGLKLFASFVQSMSP